MLMNKRASGSTSNRDEDREQPISMPGPSMSKKQKFGSLFKKHEEKRSSTEEIEITPEEEMRKEFEKYQALPHLDHEDDPLTWWKYHSHNFPNLSKLAKRYLCIPATSCASERLFSTSGHIVNKNRSKLKPAKVNMLVFLAKNLE